MRKILLVNLLLILAWMPSFAQKLRNENMAIKYIRYPEKPLPDSIKTYSTLTYNSAITEIDKNYLEGLFNLSNFKKVDTGGDLLIEINLKNYKINASGVNTHEFVDEKTKKKSYTYTYYANYSVFSSVKVSNKFGWTLQLWDRATDYAYRQEGLPSSSYAEAEKNSKLVPEDIRNNFKKEIYYCAAALKNAYEYSLITETITFVRIKQSKEGNYTQFEESNKLVEESLKQLALNKDNAAIQSKIQPAIDYWVRTKDSLQPNATAKESKNFYFATGHNLAWVYGLLGEYEKSDELITVLEGLDMKDTKMTYLKSFIKTHKARKENHDKFKEDLQAGRVELFINKTPTTKIETKPLEAGFIVLTKGDTLRGHFINFDKEIKGTRITFRNKGADYSLIHQINSIACFSAKGLIYVPMQYKATKVLGISDANSLNDGWYFATLIYSSSSVSFYVFQQNNEILFHFKKEDKQEKYMAGQGATLVGPGKRLAKVFEKYCPIVAEKAKKGEYNLGSDERSGIATALEDYEKNCGDKDYIKYFDALQQENIVKLY